MTVQEGDPKRLASYVLARMRRRRISRADLAELMDTTPRNVTKVLSGKHVGPKTLSALDDALLWKPNSSRLVLDGGEPVDASSAVDPVTVGDALGRLERAQEEITFAISILKRVT